MRLTTWATALGLLALSFDGSPAFATDRQDGPAASMDPSTDINDVYAWMDPGAGRVYMVMTVFPNAGPAATSTAKFSDKALYVFNTFAKTNYAEAIPANAVDTRVICSFDAAQTIECWAGPNEYVRGNPKGSTGTGISSFPTGNLRVYAGLHNDPAFWNKAGFTAAITRYRGLGNLAKNADGCPAVTQAQATNIVTDLRTPAATDTYAGQNVLAIVVSVKKELLVPNGKPILTVWGSTNKKP